MARLISASTSLGPSEISSQTLTMAAALRPLSLPLSSSRPLHPHHPSLQKSPASAIPLCSSSASNPEPDQDPLAAAEPATTSFAVEKRLKSAILRDGRRTAIQQAEPPNFEIGWKRTKEIKNEKPKGWAIADFLEKLESLMARGRYGSAELLVKVGSIVAERAREEAEVLLAGGQVEERMVTELHRVLKLIEMDLEMVKAAVKEETLKERIEMAMARCRQAILVALSF